MFLLCKALELTMNMHKYLYIAHTSKSQYTNVNNEPVGEN